MKINNKKIVDSEGIPNHVAIIPDGNRRWAKQQGKHTLMGHKKGLDQLVDISKKLRSMGVSTITCWGFSTENWKRTSEEKAHLMSLFEKAINQFEKEAFRDEVRIIHLGRKDRLPKKLASRIREVEGKTEHFKNNFLNIALDYGGRDEIIRACNRFIKKKKNGRLLDNASFANCLDSRDQPYPYPDLVIRTGGELRLSGFMLWQIAYAELAFVDKYLPDFSPEDAEVIVRDFAVRNRRFGK